MSSAANHRRRSHRSGRIHFQCVHSMQQFTPVGEHFGPVAEGLLRTGQKGEHHGGWRRLKKAGKRLAARVRGREHRQKTDR